MLNKLLLVLLICSILAAFVMRTPDIRRKVLAVPGVFTEQIALSGTGSMYPTFPKGAGKDFQDLANYSYPSLNLPFY